MILHMEKIALGGTGEYSTGIKQGRIKMIRECAVFSNVYLPDENFRKFYERLGYTEIDRTFGKMSFDPRIIQYIKDNSNWHSYGEAQYSIRGAKTSLFKIGFAGAATIITVDTEKQWVIRYSNGDTPYPLYVEMKVNEYGYSQMMILKEQTKSFWGIKEK